MYITFGIKLIIEGLMTKNTYVQFMNSPSKKNIPHK